MSIESTTKPIAFAVSIEAIKETLRIEQSDTSLDLTIALNVKGVTREAEHQLGRSLVSQGWRLMLDSFPDAIALFRPPIISVESVKYYDGANALQTLDPADYYVDRANTPGFIVPAPGKAWPVTYGRINAVIVEYTAGYGTTDADVPEDVQLYILARLAEQFDSTGREFKSTPQSEYVDRLLDEARTYL